MSDATSGAIRRDLNGLILREPGQSSIYLVVDGTRRLVYPVSIPFIFIPNYVVTAWDVTEVRQGPSISENAVLAQANNSAPVYLVTRGQKLHALTSEVMTRYQLNWNAREVVAPILISSIPSGPDLQMPS